MRKEETSRQSENTLEQVAPLFVDGHARQRTDLAAASPAASAPETSANTLVGKEKTKPTKRQKQRRRKKGGWKSSTGLRYKEVIDLMEGAYRIKSSGHDFTTFVTLRPPSELIGDQPRKVWCRRKAYNFQRKLARRGLPFIALSVYEKPVDGQLHLHILIYVPMKVFPLIKEMEKQPEVDVRLRTRLHLSYVVKNRLPTHPDFERVLSKTLMRKRGASFRGKRWLFSRDALAIIN